MSEATKDETPQPLAEATKIENRKNRALATKAKLECKLLEEQLTPAHKQRETFRLLASASGLLLAIVTVVGGLLSIVNWFHESNKNRTLQIEERLDRALLALSEQRPNQRLAAVVSLRSFLDDPDETRTTQVLLALTDALVIEEAAPVRNAILSALQDTKLNTANTSSLERTLQSLVQGSRGLMVEGDVWRARPGNLYRLESDLPVGPRLQAVADAMSILLRKGVRLKDMSRIYLGREDLSGLDLSGINLDDSIVAWSDFSNCTLEDASFDSSDLEDVSFVSSDLRRARLTFHEARSRSRTHWCYIERQMSRSLKQVQVQGPNFNCADLRGADFSGHALFAAVADDIPELSIVYFAASFRDTNLKGAILQRTRIFGIHRHDDDRRPFETLDEAGSYPEGALFMRYTAQIDAESSLLNEHDAFSESLQQLSLSFAGANWDSADLPTGIREWLQKSPPPKSGDETCVPRASWRSE